MASDKLLSGAQAIVEILKKEGIKMVFAYPGTSELSLCNELLFGSGINIFNGRGDKESAFLASGSSLISPNKGAALLHGARGLTNALGAIADARRNEICTVILVGLPSLSSQPFLPPHGEYDLISHAGNFAKNYFEVKKIPVNDEESILLLNKLGDIFSSSRSYPLGPVIIGLPQDFLEKECLPARHILSYQPKSNEISVKRSEIKKAVNQIVKSRRPLILIDDYFFKTHLAKKEIINLTEKYSIPFLQLEYKRGPMLFERMQFKESGLFLGMYNPDDSEIKKLLFSADLLITIEDRNMYERVIGKMPDCSIIAITSNPSSTRKNNYLNKKDQLICGNISKVMSLINNFPQNNQGLNQHKKTTWKNWVNKNRKKRHADSFSSLIASELGKILNKVKNPVLVDDSQMFGGALVNEYTDFPINLRVFGDHGAFIGGGLSQAAGLAFANQELNVFCNLGDQSFINALQGLSFVCEQSVKIVYLVCNNGKSVSLIKQAGSQNLMKLQDKTKSILFNIKGLNYLKIAESFNIKTFYIDLTLPLSHSLHQKFRKILGKAVGSKGPVVIEIKTSSDQRDWEGIWITSGFEEKKYDR